METKILMKKPKTNILGNVDSGNGFENGRTRLRVFASTPYGETIIAPYKGKFKKTMLMSFYIASQIFKGIKFVPVDLGPKLIKIVLSKDSYSLNFLRGFFTELMAIAGLDGKVRAKEIHGRYEYLITWN